jgi:phage-related protein
VAYEAGTAYISVLPSLKGFQRDLTAQLKKIAAELVVPVRPEVDPSTKEKTRREGDAAAGAFADAFQARLRAALRSLPKVEITADSSDADRRIADVRSELEALADKRIGIDVSESDALAKIAQLQAELTAVGQSDTRVSVQIDTAQAKAALDELHDKVVSALAPDLAPEAERAAGQWAETFKSRLTAAIATLPEIQVRADSSEAGRVISDVRARLEALRDKRVNIDISETAALAEVAALEAALSELGQKHPSVEVRADTAAALAKLAEIREEIRGLDSAKAEPDVKVDDGGSVSQATQGVGALRGALFALAPAAVPIAASLIPAIAGIGLAAVSAVAGVAVLKLGLSGISEAYSAFDDLQSTSTANAAKNAQAVADAERGLADARASVADASISAAERVQQAEQSLADAERTSSEQVHQALERQQSAEQSLADAQRQAMRAQIELNDARRSAARNLQDLQLAAVQADLDQRSATLQLAQAQQALISVRSNPFAAPGQLAAAQIALESAQLAAQRAALQKQRSGEDLSTAQTQGVEGAPGVVSAQDSLTQAQQGVGNAQQQVADAAQALVDAQISAAEKVAAAQQQVSDAYRAQAAQARQSAASIISAQEAVANAQNANAEAVGKVNTAMAKLAPAGQAFVLFLRSIKPELDSISQAAQQALLPGIQAGIQALLPVLPVVRDLVSQIAGALGGMAKAVGEALASPQWQALLRTLGQEIVPTLNTMGRLLGTFAEGGLRLFVALLPLANAFGQALQLVADKFVAWTQSPQLTKFIGYLSQAFAILADLLGHVGDAVLQLLVPIGNLGLAILKVAVPIVDTLLPPLVQLVSVVGDALTNALVAAAPGLLKLAQAVADFVGEFATDFGPVLGDLGTLLGDVAGVVAGVLADALHALAPLLKPMAEEWGAILKAALSLMPALTDLAQQAIPPLLSLIPELVPLFQAVADVFKDCAPPLADLVSTLVEALIPVIKDLVPIVKPTLEFLVRLFEATIRGAVIPILKDWLIPSLQLTADTLKWLVDKVVDPMMKAYGQYCQAAWDVIRPVFDSINGALKDTQTQFGDTATLIRQAWEVVEKSVGTPIKAVIDLCYNDGLVPMWNQFAFLVGAPQLSKVDTSKIPHFAGGGVLAGYAPGSDVVPALLSPGEAVLVPEVVRALGASTILAWNAALGGRPAATGPGVQHFAGGGVVTNVLALTGGAGANLLDPLTVLKNAVGGGDSPIIETLAKLPQTMLNKAADYLWKQFTSLGGLLGGGSETAGAGSAQLAQWIAAAMAFAGVPASWAGPLHTLIMRESGGNPHAINLTDFNAQRGDPSRGLTQTIGSTFNRYRDPRLSSDIYDPISNIVAGINYIKATYGSIFNVQQAVGATPKGYAGGGIVPMLMDQGGMLPPGYTTVLNATGRPEYVLTGDQFAAVTAGGDGGSVGQFVGNLYLDSGEFLGAVRGEITRAGHKTGTAITRRSRI